MKKIIIVLLLLPLVSCTEKKKQISKETKLENKLEKLQDTQIQGVYEYVYEHNSDDFKENHYLVFKDDEALYYGTSDDFDEGREGYLPGFFKSKINDLRLSEGKIDFNLTVNDSIFYISPITPQGKTNNNKKWENGLTSKTRNYSGTIKGDTIIIKTNDFDQRVFVKLK